MAETHTARAHAKLAPSSAHRWMHCPGSIPMTENDPNTNSFASAEGTAAHELAAHCLETGRDPATYLQMWIDIESEGALRFQRLDEDPGKDQLRYFEVTEEMVEAVDIYRNYVLSFSNDDSISSVEERLDMTHLHPDIYGTGDATVLQPKERHLHVFDFKYGRGVVVDVEDNPQLILYGAGAARRHHNHKLDKITLHVIQPRAPHKQGPTRSREYDLIELLDFEHDISKAAKTVDAARENRDDKPDWADTYLAAGDWCHFCTAQARCPVRRKASLAAAAETFGEVGDELTLTPPDELSDERLALVLKEADQIGNYVKAVQEYAHAQACAGKPPKGWKLVAKRARRKWVDPDVVEDELAMLGANPDEIYEPQKLRSPAQLENLFPGKNKKLRQQAMAHLVEAKSSGTNLVPENDPRPPVKAEAADEFGEVEGVA
jgi:hypothetical protein